MIYLLKMVISIATLNSSNNQRVGNPAQTLINDAAAYIIY